MRPPLPSAAVLSFSPLHRDARVQRQIRALKTICRVTAMGWTDPCIEGVRFVDMSRRPLTILQKAYKGAMLKAGFFETVYHSEEPVRKATEALADHDFGLIVANDIDTLPVVLTHRERAKILFDAHEYAPRQFEHWFLWRFFIQKYKEHLCRTRIPQVDAMTTVGPAIADEYARVFGVRPSVVLNAPYYHTAALTRSREDSRCHPHGAPWRRFPLTPSGGHDRRDDISRRPIPLGFHVDSQRLPIFVRAKKASVIGCTDSIRSAGKSDGDCTEDFSLRRWSLFAFSAKFQRPIRITEQIFSTSFKRGSVLPLAPRRR